MTTKSATIEVNRGHQLAIICGNGVLPLELAAELEGSACSPFMIGIDQEASEEICIYAHTFIHLGQIGRLFRLLAEKKITKVVLAGGISQRPDYRNLKLDLAAWLHLPKILAIMFGGDSSLLDSIIAVFEKRGIEIIAIHEIAPKLLAQQGAIAGCKPHGKEWKNLQRAYKACKLIGRLDIGQASIAISGRVVAVEGVEGTDALLRRVSDLRIMGRITGKQAEGVLVKTLKPNQDIRVDLPTIGPETIKLVSAAGLKGIGMDADRSIILQKSKTLALARSLGIFIYGIGMNEIVFGDEQ